LKIESKPMKIIACILEQTTKAAIKAMERAAPWSDMFELRIDYLSAPDLKTILSDPPRPCLVTNRIKSEGGRFQGTEAERLAILRDALALKPAMIDLELAADETSIKELSSKKSAVQVVLSHHDFDSTPELSALVDILERMNRLDADIAKIVTRIQRPDEILRLRVLLNKASEIGQTLAAFGMGPLGRLSRVLTPLWGSALSYCSVHEGKEAAPGQMSGPEMRRVFPDSGTAVEVGDRTSLYGILGSPVGHSLSPVMHNEAFRHLDLDCFYVPVDVEDATLAMACARTLGFKGLSVTRPHKVSTMALLDEIDESALTLGAINTVTYRNGKYSGSNTDLGGLVRSLEEHTSLNGKTVVVAGAGGAARAAVFGLVKAGAKVLIINRTEEKGRKLASELEGEFCPSGELKSRNPDILINATPLGMATWAEESPFPTELLKPKMLVMDMVYSPPRTRLLRDALDKGCKVIGGLSMLIHQAALQFEAWTGLTAPIEIMGDAARFALEKDNEPH
jgi:3-dehydroquinate dehydratase/shikimate dehydrogenase